MVKVKRNLNEKIYIFLCISKDVKKKKRLLHLEKSGSKGERFSVVLEGVAQLCKRVEVN